MTTNTVFALIPFSTLIPGDDSFALVAIDPFTFRQTFLAEGTEAELTPAYQALVNLSNAASAPAAPVASDDSLFDGIATDYFARTAAS